jgi:putative ABC transport system permease protein
MLRAAYSRVRALLPAEFAEEFGADMQATFESRLADARAQGRRAYAMRGVRELGGLLGLVLAERWGRGTHDAAERKALHPMDDMLREMTHAARRLLRTPGFAAAAVLTLALAIGANTAIFTLVQRVVLAPLPYPSSDRLMMMDHAAPGLELSSGIGMSTGLYREYAQLPSTQALALYTHYGMTWSGEGAAERLDVIIATPSLASVLGVAPALGRWFTEAEGERDGPGVAILTHAMWQERFGGDASVLGRTMRLDGNSYEIIGVMPRGFAFPDDAPRLLLPLQLDMAAARPGGFNFRGVARLAAGATIEQARAEQNAVIADLPARFPEHLDIARAMIGEVRLSSLALSLKDSILGESARMLWVLLASVAIVLLIACANIANLFLVRTDARQREVAVRRALGAANGRITAYFMAETLLVCVIAGVLGLVIGRFAVSAMATTDLVSMPRIHEVRMGTGTIAFAALLALLAALSFGALPVLRRMPGVASVLQDAGRGNTVSARRMRVRHGLMAVQVSLAVMLLIAAGLLVRSFEHLRRVDPGFSADTQLAFRVGLSESEHTDNASTAAFHEALLERIAALPGVEQVALTTTLPLEGDGWGDPFDVRGRVVEPGAMHPIVRMRRVSTDYFDILRIPLLSGRALEAADMSGASNVAVVNRAFADQYFPGDDVIGRQVRPSGADDDAAWLTIVGMVENTATYSLREDAATAKLYVPLRSNTTASLPTAHRPTYVVKTAGHPLALVPSIRRALDELDPHVAMARAEPLAAVVDRSRASLAFTMLLLVSAASVALLLGVIGVYAVISYAVAQRRGEIGVRLALGARPADVTGMIVRQSGLIIAVGVAAGTAGAVAGTRLMGALLYGVPWNDALTYGVVAVGLFVVALAASWVPAQRAARMDPLQSLR